MEILQTDKVFYNSPDAGDPDCLCSRCLKLITEEQVPVRSWPQSGNPDTIQDEAESEYRYCDHCQQAAGIVFLNQPGAND